MEIWKTFPEFWEFPRAHPELLLQVLPGLLGSQFSQKRWKKSDFSLICQHSPDKGGAPGGSRGFGVGI